MSEPKLSVVTPIRNGDPLLNDIPGQLRKLADDIEAGVAPGDGDPAFTRLVVLALPDKGYTPVCYTYGEAFLRRDIVGLFTVAAHMAMTDAQP